MAWLAGPPETDRRIEQLRRAGVPEHELALIPRGEAFEVWESNAKVLSVFISMPWQHSFSGVSGLDWMHQERVFKEHKVLKRTERREFPAQLRQCERWMLEEIERRRPQSSAPMH